MRNSNLLIDYQCPQCGAPAVLEETDHLFTCEYCKVKSYLLSRVYRYVLPHKADGGKRLYYVPYWRFKGLLFSCTPNGIKDRIVDVSTRGVHIAKLPPSLGLRSQTLKIRFLTPDTEGRFLQPEVTYQEMLQGIRDRYASSLPGPLFHQEFIGETLSIVYAPYYMEDRIYDAVLNRPLQAALSEDTDLNARPGGRPTWQLQFVPAQCPECGWDLEGQRDSFALNCRNCHSVWHAGKKKFMKVGFGTLPRGDGAEVTYLPFWRIGTDVSGIPLKTEADLVRLANLPKVVMPPMEENPFHFWAPAFKVRPRDFLTFSLRTTLTQPRHDLEPKLPGGTLYPVTLPVDEAMESLKLNLASFMKPPRKLYPRLPDIKISPRDLRLVYIPFNRRGQELTHPEFRLRINKTLLSYGRLI